MNLTRMTAVIAALGFLAAGAGAGTFNWVNSGGGNWGVGTNWGASAPTGTDSTDIIKFEVNSATYAVTDDIATTPFLLQQLTLGGETTGFAGTKTVTVARSGAQTLRISAGGTLELNGNLSQVGPDDLIYNVALPVELAGNLNVIGNGTATYNMNGGIVLPAGATTVTTTGSARAIFTGSVTRGANLNFAGAGTGGVTFNGTTTLTAPVAIDVTGTSIPVFTSFGGTGSLSKTGTGMLMISNSASMSGFSGNTSISGGTVRYNYSGGGGPYTLDLGSGTVAIDNATLHLNFLGASWGATATFSNSLTIGSNGATLNLGPDANGQRRSAVTFGGTVQLDGNLTFAGDGFSNGCINSPNFTNTVTLSNDRTINNTMTQSGGAPAVVFSYTSGAIFSGPTRTLTLSGGTFIIQNPTATSIDLKNILADANLTINRTSDLGSDPLSRLVANGGKLTMYTGRTLTLGGYPTNHRFTVSNVDFQPGSTLSFQQGGWDANWTVTGNLNVGGTGGPGTILYNPFRGTLTVASGNITLNNGGLFVCQQGSSHGFETINADLKLLNGGTLEGNNTAAGGLARSGGTMTLGDGTASTITIRGTNGNSAVPLQIGYGNNVTDSGNVTLRYESTGTAGSYFNVAWTGSGNPGQVPLAVREGSAATEFGPVAGGATLAMVGPATGAVFTATKPVRLTTTGTVGFYNASGANRGALGPVVLNSGASLNLQAAGTVQASAITVNSGAAITGAGTITAPVSYVGGGTLTPGNSAGTLSVGGSLGLDPATTLNYELATWNAAPGGASDFINVSGALTLDGTLNVTALTGFGPGTAAWVDYKVIGYGSLASDLGLNLGTMPAGHQYRIWTTTGVGGGPGFVMLQVPEPGALTLLGAAALLAFRRRR